MPKIDTHAHWYPPQWVDLIAKEGAANGAEVGRNERGEVTMVAPGIRLRPQFIAAYVDLETRLKLMDEGRVDMHALSLTSPMVYWAPPEFGLKLSQSFNDACSAAHQKFPNRFVGLAMVPMQAPNLAVQELERVAKLPGIRGVYMATHVNGKNLDEEEFWPIYARCEALGLAIFLHPARRSGQNACVNTTSAISWAIRTRPGSLPRRSCSAVCSTPIRSSTSCCRTQAAPSPR